MKEKLWSSMVQPAEVLYRTRDIRFRESSKDVIIDGIGCKSHDKILEIGCGPGLLSHKLSKWLPNAEVIGLDRDVNFIEYGKSKNEKLGYNVEFVLGDALALPFDDESFNVTTSHTVVEHIPTDEFFREQYRVLKKGGILSILSSRYEGAINPEGQQMPSDEEKALWEKAIGSKTNKYPDKDVAAHTLSVNELPRMMEKYGFVDVEVDFVAIDYIPNDARYSLEEKINFIEVERNKLLENMELTDNNTKGTWTEQDIYRLKQLINQRYDEQVENIKNNIHEWKVSVTMMMMLRGRK